MAYGEDIAIVGASCEAIQETMMRNNKLALAADLGGKTSNTKMTLLALLLRRWLTLSKTKAT